MISKITKELKSLNEEYNMLTSSLEVSVSKHLLNDEFTLVWANDYYYELTGYTKEEYKRIFNNNCKEYFKNDLEEFEKIRTAIAKAKNNGEKKYDEICRMPRKNGKYTWIRFVGTFTDEIIDGISVIYVVYYDINKLIEIQDKLKKEHEKLNKTLLLEEITIECIKELYKFQNLDQKLPEILEKLIKAMDADRAYIVKNEQDIFLVTYVSSRSEEIECIKSGTYLQLNPSSKWREEFSKGNSIVIDNSKEIEYISPALSKLLIDFKITSMIISPIILNNKIHSYIVVDNPSEMYSNRFSIVETISYFISIALENEKLNNILIYNSYYDNLTGLFNRNKYLDDIEKFSYKDEEIGILFMDINGLKNINDLYGHLHGDDILKEAADILRATFVNQIYIELVGMNMLF